MEIIDKLGGYKKVKEILSDCGLKIKYGTLAQQVLRESLTTPVAITLWEYCQKHKIQVSRKDFYKGE